MVPLGAQERYVMRLYVDVGHAVVLTGEGNQLTEFWESTAEEEFTWVNSVTGWWGVRREAIRCVQIVREDEYIEALLDEEERP